MHLGFMWSSKVEAVDSLFSINIHDHISPLAGRPVSSQVWFVCSIGFKSTKKDLCYHQRIHTLFHLYGYLTMMAIVVVYNCPRWVALFIVFLPWQLA